MTIEWLETLGTQFDDIFFLIGAGILVLELLTGMIRRSLTGRGFLDMIANLSTQIPYLIVELTVMAFIYAGYVAIHEYWVAWQIPVTAWTVLLGLLVADFTYYWEHRFAHEIRLLWTQHAVHHSSRFMNITVALRFGPFETLTSGIFHLPMIFMGFHPAIVFFSIVAVQAYQTWIHTELIGKLGVLDQILNTPANHRVHHGCDDKYIDRNYGGILIIWDRLFGTYKAEEETPRYGLARDFDSVNPIRVWFSELPGFFRDLGSARSFGEWWMFMFGRPGWAPKSSRNRQKAEPAE